MLKKLITNMRAARGNIPHGSLIDRVQRKQALTERLRSLKAERSNVSVQKSAAERKLSHERNALNGYQSAVERQSPGGATRLHAEQQAARQEQIVTSQQEELEALTRRCDELQAAIAEAEAELVACDQDTSLEEVLAHQKALDAADSKVAELRALMGAQEEALARHGDRQDDRLDELQRQREDLLADIATGKATQEALAALDEEIQRAVQDADGTQTQRLEAYRHAKQTLAGLQRRVQAAEDELTGLRALTPALLDQFFLSEAERTAEEYRVLAQALAEKFIRLRALERLLGELGQRPTPVFMPGTWWQMKLPAVRLGAADGTQLQSRQADLLFAAEDAESEVVQVVNAEKSRLSQRGISFR